MKLIKPFGFLLLSFILSTPLFAGIERRDAKKMFQKFTRHFSSVRHARIYMKFAPRDIYNLDSTMDQAKKFILKEEWEKAYYTSGRGIALIKLLKAKKRLFLTKKEFKRILDTIK